MGLPQKLGRLFFRADVKIFVYRKKRNVYNSRIMLELRKKYKSGSAAEIIRDAILFGDISGEVIQSDLAESLGISRIPVREALINLEYYGLIEKLPNQHVRVIAIDDRAIRDVFADMSLLEIEVIKSLGGENLASLSSLGQAEFHRRLYVSASPLRKTFLKVITETYVMFVINHSDSRRITPVFENLKSSLGDMTLVKAGYTVYTEVLAAELIRIRNNNRRMNHAEP